MITLNIEYIGYVIFVLITIYIFYKLSKVLITEEILKESIDSFYKEKGFSVDSISKLSMREKIKYGGSEISIFKFYSYFLPFFSDEVSYTRIVEVTDKNKKEFTKYLEIITKREQIISLCEFKSYDL